MRNPVNVSEFRATLAMDEPPAAMPPALRALWLDANGDWEGAHRAVQDEADSSSAWVHAYLHRKEGDLSNASYWYRAASRPQCRASLEQEWQDIVSELLIGP